MEPQTLRPTVKRNLSLFSVQAWQKGYTKYLKKGQGFWYDIYFHYDGEKVNFYHKLSDFEYFKKTVTEKLLADKELFSKLNKEFGENVSELKSLISGLTFEDLERGYELAGEIMSIYIFIVSDDFVSRQHESWDSRHLSEGILYEFDARAEAVISQRLEDLGLDKSLAHFLSISDISEVLSGRGLDKTSILSRRTGYILDGENLVTTETWTDHCDRNGFKNPEVEINLNGTRELRGQIAMSGFAKGVVKLLNSVGDIDKVNDGDIIVSIMTNLNYAPAIGRASAIITDEGGITCHAAIIARELKKPCIIGTKIATQVLKDGDLVEVDACPSGSSERACPNGEAGCANRGVVTILK